MTLPLRIVISLLLVGALLFCAFGFRTTYEPIEPAVRTVFRLIFGFGAVALAAGLVAPWRPRRPRG